jgi:hypothetical protein
MTVRHITCSLFQDRSRSDRYWPTAEVRQARKRGAASPRIAAGRRFWVKMTACDPKQPFDKSGSMVLGADR